MEEMRGALIDSRFYEGATIHVIINEDLDKGRLLIQKALKQVDTIFPKLFHWKTFFKKLELEQGRININK